MGVEINEPRGDNLIACVNCFDLFDTCIQFLPDFSDPTILNENIKLLVGTGVGIHDSSASYEQFLHECTPIRR